MMRYAGYVRRTNANTWSLKGLATDDATDAMRAALGFARGIPGWESALVTLAGDEPPMPALSAAELIERGGELLDRTESDSEHIKRHAATRLQHDAKPTGPAGPQSTAYELQAAAIQAAIKAHRDP